jgi:predicted nucleic-acid-binding protein
MVSLVDTNVIIRFLVGDHADHLKEATAIFEAVERGDTQVLIFDTVLMEAFFVLTKFYKLPKEEIVTDFKSILNFEGVVNADKIILGETLTLIEQKNIDFVDALICVKSKLQGYKKVSFDKDVTARC